MGQQEALDLHRAAFDTNKVEVEKSTNTLQQSLESLKIEMKENFEVQQESFDAHKYESHNTIDELGKALETHRNDLSEKVDNQKVEVMKIMDENIQVLKD